VRALAALGPVDVVHLAGDRRPAVPDEPDPDVRASVTLLPPDAVSGSAAPDAALAAARAAEAARDADYPAQVAEMCGAYRDRLADWLAGHRYDVVWCNRVNSWAPVHGLLTAPCVIDVDDLQNRLAQQRLDATGDAAEAENAKRWLRLQEAAARGADWLVVCSELDRCRLGVENCGVVPNVYLDAADVTPLPSDEPRPRVLLQGLFRYPPNADAARRLVDDVLPLVQREFPDARVWFVGQHEGELDRYAGRDDVRIFGVVPDVRPYVRAADVVAVPLRFGSGTRLKLLESFAMGTPVVSSQLGAEGIAATHGEHILLADDPEEQAAAVLGLLRDPAARRRIVAGARELVAHRYGAAVLNATVAEAVTQARHTFHHRRGSG
jgi:glycosyltransferase involved in cell wall biosynthesis